MCVVLEQDLDTLTWCQASTSCLCIIEDERGLEAVTGSLVMLLIQGDLF